MMHAAEISIQDYHVCACYITTDVSMPTKISVRTFHSLRRPSTCGLAVIALKAIGSIDYDVGVLTGSLIPSPHTIAIVP